MDDKLTCACQAGRYICLHYSQSKDNTLQLSQKLTILPFDTLTISAQAAAASLSFPGCVHLLPVVYCPKLMVALYMVAHAYMCTCTARAISTRIWQLHEPCVNLADCCHSHAW